jgi:hypothetical protein
MRSAKHITTFALSVLALAGCADTGATTGVLVTASGSCANLSGNFEATGFTVTSTANSTVRQDLLGGGGTFGLDFADGNFTSTFLGASDTTATTNTGAFTATSGSITLGNQTLFTGGATGSQLFTCSVFGNTLTLTSPNTNFLFPGTTTAQPANITITLRRTT